MADQAVPVEKKSKLAPPEAAENIDMEASSKVDENDSKPYTNESVYANKSSNHTIEHVYSLGHERLRTIHWRECVLSSPDNTNEILIEACVKAEQRDCLSTVFLATSTKDWGTTQTEAQLKALKEDQAAQVMDDEYNWELKAEENFLDSTLLSELRKNRKDGLQGLMEITCYKNEAHRRLRAVVAVLSGISDAERDRIINNDLCYELILAKLRLFCNDPREELLQDVALFHWVLRSNPSEEKRTPLV